jgi:hypothetical protein
MQIPNSTGALRKASAQGSSQHKNEIDITTYETEDK